MHHTFYAFPAPQNIDMYQLGVAAIKIPDVSSFTNSVRLSYKYITPLEFSLYSKILAAAEAVSTDNGNINNAFFLYKISTALSALLRNQIETIKALDDWKAFSGRVLKAIDRLIASVLACSTLTTTKPETLPKQMINSNGDKTNLTLAELNHGSFNKVCRSLSSQIV